MSEKRRPDFVFIADIRGKRFRLELFPATLWPARYRRPGRRGPIQYRLRANGRWYPKGFEPMTISQFTAILRRTMVKVA